MKEDQHNFLFKVPTTKEGLIFLELAQKFLNTKSYSLKRRGRAKNRRLIYAVTGNPSHLDDAVPLKYADDIAVYLYGKHKERGHCSLSISTLKSMFDYRKRWFSLGNSF